MQVVNQKNLIISNNSIRDSLQQHVNLLQLGVASQFQTVFHQQTTNCVKLVITFMLWSSPILLHCLHLMLQYTQPLQSTKTYISKDQISRKQLLQKIGICISMSTLWCLHIPHNLSQCIQQQLDHYYQIVSICLQYLSST